MPNLHVIHRREPGLAEQWSVYSFPESVYTGGSSPAEARSRFREAAEYGIDDFADHVLVEHIEEPLTERAFIRTAVDRHSLDRREAAKLFAGSLTLAEQAAAFDRDAPSAADGTAVVVACIPTDTVRWVLEQMGEKDALSICVAQPGDMVWWSYLAHQFAELPEHSSTESLADADLEVDATLSELIREGGNGEPGSDAVSYRPGLLISA